MVALSFVAAPCIGSLRTPRLGLGHRQYTHLYNVVQALTRTTNVTIQRLEGHCRDECATCPVISCLVLSGLSCLVSRLWLTLLTPCIAVGQNGRQQRKRCEEGGPREKIRVVSALTPTLTLTQTVTLTSTRNCIFNACLTLTPNKVSERHSSSSHRRHDGNGSFSRVLSPKHES